MKSKIVVADIHGNLILYKKFLQLFLDKKADEIIFLGDFIDFIGPPNEDRSYEIIQDMRQYDDSFDFTAVAGNHESTHARNEYIYRNNRSLTNYLKTSIRNANKGKLQPYYDETLEWFKQLPHIYQSDNLLFQHGGAPSHGFNGSNIISQIQWNIRDDYTKRDVDAWLKAMKSSFLISGHEHPPGGAIDYGKQFILNSLDGLYLLIDREINSINDLYECLREIDD